MIESQDIISLAGMTTVVGMGVVFSALLLLSVYMSIFKIIIERFESLDNPNKHALDSSSKKPTVESSGDDQAHVAAAIGVGLFLDGKSKGVPTAIAAAIGTALHLHLQPQPKPFVGARRLGKEAAIGSEGWKFSGRLRLQQGRKIPHLRPRV